jgi:hypothetical protein
VIKLIKPSISTTEYWMVENRHPTGWDQGITGLVSGFSGGLLVTHIDITAGTVGYNDINEYSASLHQGVVPEQANSTSCNMLAGSCRGAATTTFYAGNSAAFGAATTPAAQYYSGISSEIEIKNISGRSATMTFDLEFTVVPPVITEFVVPSGYSSLEVPINTFTVTSTKPITGYLVTETSSSPSLSDTSWSSTQPSSYRFASAGSKILYAWAKDQDNNLSASRSSSVQVSIVSTATIESSTTLQAAYDNAASSATMRAGAKAFSEHLVFNRLIDVTLDGGFDTSYQNKEGYTSLVGSLTIVQGSAVISDLIIK